MTKTLNKDYHQRIITAIGDADSIYIFGPAEAKFELKKAIEQSRYPKKPVVSMEPADKMTQNQIAARIPGFF